ncbi:MAG: hypothetical protein IJ659_00830 [Alloprevotella sp.]|nr:hypothetical protein [Alloprevotella sp.]
MKKLLLLMTALLMGVSGAWAVTITVTSESKLWSEYGTWTAYTSDTWGTTWKSENEAVCITSSNTGYINRTQSQIAQTNVTIWTPADDVMITGYSITFKSNHGNGSTITGAAKTVTSSSTTDEKTFEVTGIYSHNAIFKVVTSMANIVSFTVTYETLPSKSAEGFYFIKNRWDANNTYYLLAQPSVNAAKAYKYKVADEASIYSNSNYVWKISSYDSYRVIQNVATSRYISNFNAAYNETTNSTSRDGSYVNILNTTSINDAEIFTETDRSSVYTGAIAFLAKSKATDCWLNSYNSTNGGAVGFYNASHEGDRMLLTRVYKVTFKSADENGNEVAGTVPVNGTATNAIYVPANTILASISGAKYFIGGVEKTEAEVKTAVSEVTDDNLVVYVTPLHTTVTINFKKDDETIATKELSVKAGFVYDIVTSLGFQSRYISTNPATVTGSTSDQNIDVETTFTLPFNVSSNPVTDESMANVYYLTLNSKHAKGNQLTTSLDYEDKDYFWTFGGDYINGFTIYNKGQENYMSNGTEDNSVAAFDGSQSKYMLYSNTDAGVYFKVKGTEQNYLNDRGSKLSTWNQYDLVYWVEAGAASSFTGCYMTIESVEEDLSDAYAYLDSRTIGNSLGQYTAGDYTNTDKSTALSDALTAYNDGNAYTVAAAAKSLWAIRNEISGINVPSEGQFVYFKSRNNSRYAKAVDTNASSVQMQTSDGQPTIDNIFAFIGNKFVSYSKGRYIVNTRDMAALGTDGSTFEFLESDNPGMYFIKCGSNYMYGYDTGNESIAKLDRTSTTSGYEAQCRWYIQEVTSLPVTIGVYNMKTFNAPVAVTIPNYVEAYYATLDGNNVILTQIEGTIPKNTPVILYRTDNETVGSGEARTFDFAIADDVDAITGNALTGTIAAKAIETGDHTLQYNKSTNQFGFYLPLESETCIKGFSAYISVSEESRGFQLIMPSTGVETISFNSHQKNIYDLQGRRIEKAGKGLYIVNGKKVIF